VLDTAATAVWCWFTLPLRHVRTSQGQLAPGDGLRRGRMAKWLAEGVQLWGPYLLNQPPPLAMTAAATPSHPCASPFTCSYGKRTHWGVTLSCQLKCVDHSQLCSGCLAEGSITRLVSHSHSIRQPTGYDCSHKRLSMLNTVQCPTTHTCT
jgi:hypothetical protein